MPARRKTRPPLQPDIEFRGARTHNLKNITGRIPAGKMTVITGVSGSGKSSLAFDTLYAEGQRRYVESLSTYARQFIGRMPRPDVDHISHIPPAIALEQKNSVKNARSTIGTATEINDYLRLIWAKIGRIKCPTTGEEVRADAPEGIARTLLAAWKDARIYIVAPIPLQKQEMLEPTLKELLRQGFTRLLLDGEVTDIDDPDFSAPTGLRDIPVLVDRLAVRAQDRSRLVEAIEGAYRLAGGRCQVRARDGETRLFTEELRCASCPGDCGNAFQVPSPQVLNFGNPLGACPTCQGFGRVTGLDWGKIIPDPSKSIRDGAIAPWSGEVGYEWVYLLRTMANRLGIRVDVPWRDLTREEQDAVRFGKKQWVGIKGYFDELGTQRYKVQARIMIARFRGYADCPDCGGTRLRAEARAIHVGGRTIGSVCDDSIKKLAAWFAGLELTEEEAKIVERPLAEVRSRLGYLLEVGLGYLTLSRQTRTLSGGESQRINLSTSLGSALTETLYVLDEPTVGLHPRDTERLVGVLHRLRDLGNTVIVVEHDPDVMRASDHLVDIGPKAGEGGGEIIWEGTAAEAKKAPEGSLTGQYLRSLETAARKKKASRRSAASTRFGRREPQGWITIRGASENNLRHLDVRLPLGVLCCVTGVSGSGKSSLIKTCFYENYRRLVKGEADAEPGAILGIDGLDQVDDIIMVDQSAIGRSSRSNPATYLKAYDQIRSLLASTADAEAHGLEPRDFSFNVAGGRCEACEGTGMQTIDMHFLADVNVVCDVCEGQRFQDQVLEVRYKGKNVSDILDMTVNEAIAFFADEKRVLAGLQPLANVGLGYLRMGQSTATLSGGEAQRLKLAAHMAQAASRFDLLLLFDEPTTGLHPADLEVLLGTFEELLEQGFSLIVIEHNLQLIRQADYIIDIGPEGGEGGGHIVCEGTPEEVAAHPESLTGQFLAREAAHHTEPQGA